MVGAFHTRMACNLQDREGLYANLNRHIYVVSGKSTVKVARVKDLRS